MKISRITVLTLGVIDLHKATTFYENVLDTPPNRSYNGVTFIELPGTWLALYPLETLAKDIGLENPITNRGFSGITLAYNAQSKNDVMSIIVRAKRAGAHVVKEPQDTFWGGFSGYFTDSEGYHWEVAWGPMFEFAENGELRFKNNVK